jgi:putative membrane protein
MDQYLGGLQAFLLWLGVSIALAVAFVGLYMWITPQHELKLIHEGNISAAVCLGGTLLGYVLPLASAMVHGVNLHDFLIWGVIAMLVQLAVYLVLRLSMRTLTQDILADRVSVAILVASISLSAGVLNAAAIST